LKNNPEMAKLIQNITSAINGEQSKDNDIDVTKYLESNKHALSDSAEKHYENLVEVLTNNAICTAIAAASSPSNPPFFLPQSSSSFSKPV
jgi:hypothetical protein